VVHIVPFTSDNSAPCLVLGTTRVDERVNKEAQSESGLQVLHSVNFFD
jgi:hypothetical protein